MKVLHLANSIHHTFILFNVKEAQIKNEQLDTIHAFFYFFITTKIKLPRRHYKKHARPYKIV